jgi:hypothetical protein
LVIRITVEKRVAKEAAEEVLRDQRIICLEHLAGLAVNCEEHMIRLEDTIIYNNW